jgi:Chaperone for flagella basal body P-ring formation
MAADSYPQIFGSGCGRPGRPVTMADVGGMNVRGVALPSWLRLRVAGAMILVLACAFAGATLLSRSSPQPRYWASTHALAVGTVITDDDITLVAADLPDGAQPHLRAADTPIGQSVRRALADGQLLTRTALGSAPKQTSIVIPLAAGTAPTVQRGQRIRLWASTAGCPLATVLADVAVQSVTTTAASGFGTAGTQLLVVSLDNDLAARVVAARALTAVTLRAAVLDGPPDPTDTAALPELSVCQSS